MPDTNLIGVVGPADVSAAIRNEISSFAINYFPNRTPLLTRLARKPVTSPTFTIVSRKLRPRTYTLGGAIITSDTTITLGDASGLMVGDVLQLFSTAGTTSEYIVVTADPVGGVTNTATITRAHGSTSAVANTNVTNTTLYLIGNSRTGAEYNQTATTWVPTALTQQCQNFQHVVQVGGSLASTGAFVGNADGSNAFSQIQMATLQALMDDIETSSMYGKGEALSTTAGTRPAQKGLRVQCATNLVTAPQNSAAYKPTDFIRDGVQACVAQGGSPNFAIVSYDFMSGLAVWGAPAVRINAGSTALGVAIDTYYTPLCPQLALIYSPMLRAGTFFVGNSNEIRIRNKRNEFWNPHGVRGNLLEGDFIAEMAIEAENEQHHAWVEGITAFSAT